MNKKVKKIILPLFVILGVGVLAVLGLKSFVNSIIAQRSCDWANIDNIELHARVDIPDITLSDCNYDESTNTKKAYFELDKNSLDIDRYLQKNKLYERDSSEIDFSKFLISNRESIQAAKLYYRSNLPEGKSSYILFDRDTHRLWVSIKYSD